MKKQLKKTKQFFKNYIRKVYAPLARLGCSLLVIITIATFIFAILFLKAYMELMNTGTINIQLFKWINWCKLLEGKITSTSISSNIVVIKTKIEFLMNALIAFSSIILSLTTYISYLRKNYEFRNNSCFTSVDVFEDGVEDIQIMSEYYKGADELYIYSKTYLWVKTNENIRNIMISLAQSGKLHLYTNGDLTSVKSTLSSCDPIFNNCIKKKNVDLRFSYVIRNNAKYLLYKQEKGRKQVIVVRENQQSEYLLTVLSELVHK